MFNRASNMPLRFSESWQYQLSTASRSSEISISIRSLSSNKICLGSLSHYDNFNIYPNRFHKPERKRNKVQDYDKCCNNSFFFIKINNFCLSLVDFEFVLEFDVKLFFLYLDQTILEVLGFKNRPYLKFSYCQGIMGYLRG